MFYERQKSPLTLYSSTLAFYFINFISCLLDTTEVSLSNTLWKFILDLTSTAGPPYSTWQSKKCTWISHLESFLREKVLKYTSDLLMKIIPKKQKSLAEAEPPDTPKEYSNSFGSGRDIFSLQNSMPRTPSPSWKITALLNSRGTTHQSYTAEP